MEQSENEREVKLYRWPLSRGQRYVTRRGMFLRLFVYAVSLALAFALGVLWSSFRDPQSGRFSQEQGLDKDVVRGCCLKDVRTAQEALTKLSVDAQKLRLRLAAATKGPVQPQIASSIDFLEERARAVWDQLESLLQDSNERRRKLRDIRINLEGLKEHFQLAENCCGPAPEGLPSLKHYLQTAELRFQVVQARVSPAYIEGEINVREVAHETGYSYLLKQEFGTAGDTMEAPNASNLRIYEDGVALGPPHSQHADVRQFGRGRYSHWVDTLYFSASDNSDPMTNKRHYTYRSYSGAAVDPQASAAVALDSISSK